jgi:hypothetical protein
VAKKHKTVQRKLLEQDEGDGLFRSRARKLPRVKEPSRARPGKVKPRPVPLADDELDEEDKKLEGEAPAAKEEEDDPPPKRYCPRCRGRISRYNPHLFCFCCDETMSHMTENARTELHYALGVLKRPPPLTQAQIDAYANRAKRDHHKKNKKRGA